MFESVLTRLLAQPRPKMAALALIAAGQAANAGGGLLGLDHELPLAESGIWARHNQLALQFGVVAFEAAGAVWLGNDDPFGHALWQSLDASAAGALASAGLKRVFGRARPNQGQGPNAWFQGNCCESFPSGEVTLQASFVTPIIVEEAGAHPWVWSLELLPLYDGIARIKSQAHWQSDVLAGWALGTAAGYWATTRKVPFFVEIMPRGAAVGFAKRF
jgi:membrane-associated phospholipid phosphatase